MIKKILPVFLVAALLLFAGCAQKEAETETPTTQGIQETGDTSINPDDIPVLEQDDSVVIGEMIEEPTSTGSIDAADIPLLEENDSVDIGEMI